MGRGGLAGTLHIVSCGGALLFFRGLFSSFAYMKTVQLDRRELPRLS